MGYNCSFLLNFGLHQLLKEIFGSQQLNVGFIHKPIFSFIFYLPFLAGGLHSVFYQNHLAYHQKIYESGETNDSSQKHQSNDDISRVYLNFTVCKYLSNLKMWFIEQFMTHKSLFGDFSRGPQSISRFLLILWEV